MKDARIAQVDHALREAQAILTDEPVRAVDLCRAAYALAGEIDHATGLARGALYAGFALYMCSEHDEALAFTQEAETRFRELGDEVGEARAWGHIAGIEFSLGNFDRAMAYAFKALQRAREANHAVEEAWCLQGIGSGYYEMADHESALRYFQEALVLFDTLKMREVPDRPMIGKARTLIGIGNVHQRMGQLTEALARYEEARHLFDTHGDRIGLARALNDIGTLHQVRGQFDEALDCHHEALALRKTYGNVQAQSTSLLHIGQIHLRQAQYAEARQVLHDGLALAQKTKAKLRIYQIHEALSEAYAADGDFEQALAHHKAFQQVKEQVLGDASHTRLKNLHVQYALAQADLEAELAQQRNDELKESNDRLETLLETLHRTQDQLVHAEKMGSLGQLTAGIAHEIKNPLNFINNFAVLSVELVDELLELLEAQTVSEETRQLLNDLKTNQDKIHAHGRRADGIIQSMLDHSRATASHRQDTDVNALLDQYLHLAYHGMRAQDAGLNVTLHTDYDADVGEIEAIPQDLGRVFLNILNNAFYAVHKTGRDDPAVWVSSQRQDDAVVFRIRDNGPGIPPEVQKKIFEPFFTTKPTGEGTGLGLWLSYDIVAKGHGGTLDVDSTEGEGTTFIIRLPV